MRSNDVSRLFVLCALSGLAGVAVGGCTSRAVRVENDVMKRFPTLDKDNDGRLSRAEFAASHGTDAKTVKATRGMFDRVDADNNDGITSTEMKRAVEWRKKQ